MKYLLDTDHIVILQRQQGAEFHTLSARIAQHPTTDIGFSLVSFHEQVLGCHTFIARARTASELERGYRMLGRVLQDFAKAPVLPMGRSWPRSIRFGGRNSKSRPWI